MFKWFFQPAMLNGKGKQSWLVGSNILAHITCCLTFRTHCAHTFHKTPGYRNLGYVQIGTLFPMLFWHQFEHTPSSENSQPQFFRNCAGLFWELRNYKVLALTYWDSQCPEIWKLRRVDLGTRCWGFQMWGYGRQGFRKFWRCDTGPAIWDAGCQKRSRW